MSSRVWHAVTKKFQRRPTCGSLVLLLASAKVHGGSGGTFGSGAPGADAVAPPWLKKAGFRGFLAHAIILGGTQAGTDAKALLSPIVAA